MSAWTDTDPEAAVVVLADLFAGWRRARAEGDLPLAAVYAAARAELGHPITPLAFTTSPIGARS